MSAVRGNVASTPWGSTLAGLAQQRATCVLELRADDGRGPFQIHLSDGIVVDAQARVPGAEAIQVALACNLVMADDVARVRGAVMAARNVDEIDAIATAIGLTSDESMYLRRRTVAHRAALTFGVAYGQYASIDGVPAGRHVDLEVHPIVYLGALTYMPAQRIRDELLRFGDQYQIADTTQVVARFGFAEAEAAVVESLRTPQTQESLASFNRHLGAREVLSVLYALVTTGVAKGSRRATPATSPRNPVPGGVTFKSKTSPPAVPAIPPAPVMPLVPAPAPALAPTPLPATMPTSTPPPPPAASAAESDEGTFDLAAALLDDLGDAPLAFEAAVAPPTPATPAAVAAAAAAPRSRTARRTEQLLRFLGQPGKPDSTE